MKTFKLPDLGEGLQEAEIVAWHVNAGDHIVVDQPLLSVETDKAIVDVPSPFAGKVLTLHAKVGDVVALDGALVDIDDGGQALGQRICGEGLAHGDGLRVAGRGSPIWAGC